MSGVVSVAPFENRANSTGRISQRFNAADAGVFSLDNVAIVGRIYVGSGTFMGEFLQAPFELVNFGRYVGKMVRRQSGLSYVPAVFVDLALQRFCLRWAYRREDIVLVQICMNRAECVFDVGRVRASFPGFRLQETLVFVDPYGRDRCQCADRPECLKPGRTVACDALPQQVRAQEKNVAVQQVADASAQRKNQSRHIELHGDGTPSFDIVREWNDACYKREIATLNDRAWPAALRQLRVVATAGRRGGGGMSACLVCRAAIGGAFNWLAVVSARTPWPVCHRNTGLGACAVKLEVKVFLQGITSGECLLAVHRGCAVEVSQDRHEAVAHRKYQKIDRKTAKEQEHKGEQKTLIKRQILGLNWGTNNLQMPRAGSHQKVRERGYDACGEPPRSKIHRHVAQLFAGDRAPYADTQRQQRPCPRQKNPKQINARLERRQQDSVESGVQLRVLLGQGRFRNGLAVGPARNAAAKLRAALIDGHGGPPIHLVVALAPYSREAAA